MYSNSPAVMMMTMMMIVMPCFFVRDAIAHTLVSKFTLHQTCWNPKFNSSNYRNLSMHYFGVVSIHSKRAGCMPKAVRPPWLHWPCVAL
jgi:hypothetical protein